MGRSPMPSLRHAAPVDRSAHRCSLRCEKNLGTWNQTARRHGMDGMDGTAMAMDYGTCAALKNVVHQAAHLGTQSSQSHPF